MLIWQGKADAGRGHAQLARIRGCGRRIDGIIGLAVIVVLILAGIYIGAYSRRLRGIARSRIYLAGLALLPLAWIVDAVFGLGLPPQLVLAIFAALLIFKIAVEVLAPAGPKRGIEQPNPGEPLYPGITSYNPDHGGGWGDGGDGADGGGGQ
ncbi:MAG: hypothetical protein WBP94_03255 [Rhodomicrobiaceae bacterium]